MDVWLAWVEQLMALKPQKLSLSLLEKSSDANPVFPFLLLLESVVSNAALASIAPLCPNASKNRFKKALRFFPIAFGVSLAKRHKSRELTRISRHTIKLKQ
jgi:hypothetical protein